MIDLSQLNYQHLYYFWVTAREGGINKAGAVLRLSPSTISAQVRQLEDQLEVELFERSSRGLSLTAGGRLVQRYADDIFDLGRQLLGAVDGRTGARPMRLTVGVADVVPKLVAYAMMKPLLDPDAPPVMLTVHEDHPEALLAALASHQMDVVLLDQPVGPTAAVRVHHHALGESRVGLFGHPRVIEGLRGGFPGCLDGAPVLLPTAASSVRRGLDAFFDRQGLRPRVIAEFEDSALMKVFGQGGHGLFPAPMVVGDAIRAQYGVALAGEIDVVTERFYAVTAERRIKHPAAVLLTRAARRALEPVGPTAAATSPDD
jgi:LysR family transcriptional activator of nhaA